MSCEGGTGRTGGEGKGDEGLMGLGDVELSVTGRDETGLRERAANLNAWTGWLTDENG